MEELETPKRRVELSKDEKRRTIGKRNVQHRNR
jgi:hypothetical protein